MNTRVSVTAIALVITLSLFDWAAAKPADLWDSAHGAKMASEVIENCLSKSNDGIACALEPYEACEKQHGTASQMDIADCAVFAHRAWALKYDSAYQNLRSITQGRKTEKPSDWRRDAASQLEEYNATWRRAAELDCKLQTAAYGIGSISGFSKELCLVKHTALAAIEARLLLEKWAKLE